MSQAVLLAMLFAAVTSPPSGPPTPQPAPFSRDVPPPPAAELRGGRIITKPDWLRIPTPEEFEEAYPKQAWSDDVEGSATILCKVRRDNTLYSCAVEAEEPAGRGFGAAALSVAPYFEMRPKTVNGVPVDGAWVRIPVAFRIPEADDSPWTIEEALRCYVSASREVKANPGNAKAAELKAALAATFADGVKQGYVTQERLDGYIADVEGLMTRGEINGDWCF